MSLSLKTYKLQKAQLLIGGMKKIRVQRCRWLLRLHADQEIVFTDEKISTIVTAHNHQNNRIWSKSPLLNRIVTHSQNLSLLMVWGGICATGKTPSFCGSGDQNTQKI